MGTLTPWLDDGDVRLYLGDVRDVLAALPNESVDCCITSPPYWGLRDYGSEGQLGLEPTPDAYVQNMVAVFREVRRVLAPHGTCWLNLGDSYASSPKGNPGALSDGLTNQGRNTAKANEHRTRSTIVGGLKPKDLVGIPWRVAFALQADGWWLRSEIIWAKPNPMPESVTDRPTKSHEQVFLLAKRPSYWFDQEAVREPLKPASVARGEYGHGCAFKGQFNGSPVDERHQDGKQYGKLADAMNPAGRNVRSVWDIATQPFPDAHFATYPQELVRRCLLAGCPAEVCGVCGKPRERIVDVGYDNPGNRTTNGPRSLEQRHETQGFAQRLERRAETTGWSDCGHGGKWRPGVVLDPFLGSGTTALVARHHGRHAVGIELNEEYARIAAKRLQQLSLLGELT